MYSTRFNYSGSQYALRPEVNADRLERKLWDRLEGLSKEELIDGLLCLLPLLKVGQYFNLIDMGE